MSKVQKHRRASAKFGGVRKEIRPDERKRYDLWSRAQSDTFRWKVARILESRCNLPDRGITDPYGYYASLPGVSWTDGEVSANLALAQLRALFSKDGDMKSGIDQEAAAFQKFVEFEDSCRLLNDRIMDGSFSNDRDVACIVSYAQRKIASILGDPPRIEDLQLTFGPGAAVSCRKKTTARFKLSTPPSISRPAVGVSVKLANLVPRWYLMHGKLYIMPGVLEFVTKNAEEHRAIVLPPSLTGMAQRAVGTHMKQKLLVAGINLYDQSINRERARLASLTGDDATVDLRGASDSIAYMLPMELLPLPWFELIDSLRDDRVLYRGESISLEKFSSMGNGFTFELESVIFYGLIYGIARHHGLPFTRDNVTVYGDDIVAPTAIAERILEYFPRFGLTVNTKKSFLTGPFRESCGGDFVHGIDVRPFFLRGRVTVHVLVTFYNHLMRKPHQDPERKLRDLILCDIPSKYQNFGPDGYGDGHLVSNADIRTYCTPHKRELGYSGFTFESYIEKATRSMESVVGDILLPAYVVASRDERSWTVKYGLDILRGQYRDAFVRHLCAEISDPPDHYVIRKRKGSRGKEKKIRIYVLGNQV